MSAIDFRILDFNYAFQSNVAISASSENAEFPATNIGHEFRSKVWRSSGYYVVTSSNNKVNFKEAGAGPELTATLTPGGYSTTALASEIKSAMESASVNARTYTVTRSSTTGQWTIAGSVYLEILFSTGTNATTSLRDVIGFASNDFTGDVTYTGPKTAIHTEESIVIDLKTSEEIDTVALLFDPLAGVKLSEMAVVTLQGSATNAWTTPGFEQVLTLNQNFLVYSAFLPEAKEYRFWRIKIVDPMNPYLYVELGTIMIGKFTSLGRCPDNGFEYKTKDPSKVEATPYGHEYTDEYPLQRELTINFNVFDYTVKQTMESIFRRVGTRTPVLIVLDAQEQLFNKDEFMLYGKLKNDTSWRHFVKNYFASGLSVREVF